MRFPQFPVTNVKGNYFRNPFALLAHTTHHTNPNGRVTPELLMHYKARTKLQGSLIIAGPATIVPPTSRKYSLLRVDQPKYLDGLRALSKILSATGAIAGIQITHPAGYEANELQEAIPELRATLNDEMMERIQTAYNNAFTRSIEVGFRYIELHGSGSLALHQLIATDKKAVVTEIFENAIKACDDVAVCALRLHPACPHRDEYADQFIEMGGDLVALENDGRVHENFDKRYEGKNIPNLQKPLSHPEILKFLGKNFLLGLPSK